MSLVTPFMPSSLLWKLWEAVLIGTQRPLEVRGRFPSFSISCPTRMGAGQANLVGVHLCRLQALSWFHAVLLPP